MLSHTLIISIEKIGSSARQSEGQPQSEALEGHLVALLSGVLLSDKYFECALDDEFDHSRSHRKVRRLFVPARAATIVVFYVVEASNRVKTLLVEKSNSEAEDIFDQNDRG